MTTSTYVEYVQLSPNCWLDPTSSTAVTLYVTNNGQKPDDSTGQANVLYSQSLTLATVKAAVNTVLTLDSSTLHGFGG